jgi:hypothetical protein
MTDDTDQCGGHIGLGLMIALAATMWGLLIYCGIRGYCG